MPATGMANRLTMGGLLLIGLLPVAGRILPPTAGWGFRHAAYLHPAGSILLLALWAALLVRPLRHAVSGIYFDRFGGWLFGRSSYPVWIVSSASTALFVLLRTPTRFLGDGVLVGELVGLGSRFRIHDMMDFLLHRLVLEATGGAGSKPASFRLYAIGSFLAGFLAVATALLLLRRCRKMTIPARMFAFSLWILAAPTLLYCGYIESYGYFSVAMLGFLWSGAMTQRGEAPAWVPGIFFGLAGFFHSTAIFAAPALLYLAVRPGIARARRGRWAAQVLFPALLLPAIAIGLHLAMGYNADMFRRDFIESKNQKHLLIRLTGPHGLLSITHFKDVLNWMLLVIPVTGWLILTRARAIRARPKEPEIRFLLVQIGCFLLPLLLLDPKLGAARDWDLLTPQIAGFAFLAAVLWRDECADQADAGVLPPIRIAAPWVALLLVGPWLALNATSDGAIRRFDEMRRDFPTFARAYSAEELAKYNYEHGDFEKSLTLYQECVNTYPGNARTRILLGSNFLVLNRLREAEEQYDKAIEIDPNNWLALDSKARLDLRLGKTGEALELYRRIKPARMNDPEFWSGYGYAALSERQFEEGRDALMRSLQIKMDAKVLYYAGLAYAYLGRWNEAIGLLQRSLDEGNDPALVSSALGAALEGRHVAALARGEAGSIEDLERARELVKMGLAAAPEDPRLTEHLSHLDRVLAGEAPARNLLRP